MILICIKCNKKYNNKQPPPGTNAADEFAGFLDRDYMNDRIQAFTKLMGRGKKLGEYNNLCPNCDKEYKNILKHITEERLSKIKWYYES